MCLRSLLIYTAPSILNIGRSEWRDEDRGSDRHKILIRIISITQKQNRVRVSARVSFSHFYNHALVDPILSIGFPIKDLATNWPYQAEDKLDCMHD